MCEVKWELEQFRRSGVMVWVLGILCYVVQLSRDGVGELPYICMCSEHLLLGSDTLMMIEFPP